MDSMQEFRSAYEAGPNGSVQFSKLQDEHRVNWQTQIREGIIHCGNRPVEFDFFEKMISGGAQNLDATDLYTKYDCDRQYNIFAESAAQGTVPGGPVTFTLMRAQHSRNGMHSNAVVNGNIYIYEDRQWLQITSIDTTVPYAHQVTARPFKAAYIANIRAGKEMMYNPTRHTDGYTCKIPNTQWQQPGFIKKWSSYRVRKDWEVAFKMDGPYHEQLRFHLIFDREGNEVDGWELYAKQDAREQLQAQKNLDFFIGQQRDNPALTSLYSDDYYPGFEGLMPILRYGGGGRYDFDPAYGFDIESDFQNIILQQDAHKRTKEFMLWHGIRFGFGLTNRSNELFKNNAGSCTFETFTRSGAGKADIEKLMVNSIKYGNYSIHLKEVDAWSDSRYLGNAEFPNLGILMPGNGLTDSKGRSVSAVEFFNVTGKNQQAVMESKTVNHFDSESGCEKFSGSIIENYGMMVHCPGQWALLNPIPQ